MFNKLAKLRFKRDRLQAEYVNELRRFDATVGDVEIARERLQEAEDALFRYRQSTWLEKLFFKVEND